MFSETLIFTSFREEFFSEAHAYRGHEEGPERGVEELDQGYPHPV